MKVVIPVCDKLHEFKIDPQDYDLVVWHAYGEYGFSREGLIKGVENLEAEVPEVIKELLKKFGQVAFFCP